MGSSSRTNGDAAMKWLLILAYVLTIPAANFLIENVGTTCSEICLVPVGFGLMAPSGVLMIGVALVLRDLVQKTFGIKASLICILLGAIISAILSPPALVVASVCAFLFGEILDFAVYTPLQKRGFLTATIASGICGSVLDSILFLLLAFGSIDYVAGQIVGKWISVGCMAIVANFARKALEGKDD
jgi:uncharacterized PurR-regulated membrane protein YhhQ (DUF165 family)